MRIKRAQTLSVILTAVCLQTWAFGASVHAQVIGITPEVAGKMIDLAQAARRAQPSSPADAASAFAAAYRAAFDQRSVNHAIVNTPELTVVMMTPFDMASYTIFAALRMMAPIPTIDVLTAFKTVSINVLPAQFGAPDISRVVAFRGDRQFEPISSTLQPQVFRNGSGATVTLHQGSVEFSDEIVQPGSDLKVVLIGNGAPIEWTLPAVDVATLK